MNEPEPFPCDGRGNQPDTDWVEHYAVPSGRTCRGCPACRSTFDGALWRFREAKRAFYIAVGVGVLEAWAAIKRAIGRG